MAKVQAMLLTAVLCGVSVANMYDVVLPTYRSTCSNGCLPWASAGGANATLQTIIDNMFNASSAKAGASCAMPANHAGDNECDCGQKDGETYIFDSYEGPWCYCKDPIAGENTTQYCNPALQHPEQINLQVAAADAIVVGFVTYESQLPAFPPVAEIGLVGSAAAASVTGLSRWYAPPGRTANGTTKNGDSRYAYAYTMSYIRFAVEPGQRYTYRVRSGSPGAFWSQNFTFRAPRTGAGGSAPTAMATYGDMGHSHYNSMQNVQEDCAAGRIDAILHMGDHAYNIGFSADRRGDAYMNAFQPTLASCPWFPIIGNHESSDGDHYKHYEAIAFGEEYGNPAPQLRSTATSALGAHLSAGTFYGAGLHSGVGTVPSNTSRFASADVGLIHVVGLDLNNLDAGQLAWLNADLAAANSNRAVTPWIMVASHFPIFHTKTSGMNARMSVRHYLGDELLSNYTSDADGVDFVPCAEGDATCTTIGEWQLGKGEALQPLFKKYGVDVYNAGHVHSYESTWPICDLTTGTLCPNGQSFNQPQGPVHVTEGNGGVPGVHSSYEVHDCSASGGFCRKTASGGAYARVTAHNATHLTYEHVQNNGGNVTDSWTIFQPNHGPFEHMA